MKRAMRWLALACLGLNGCAQPAIHHEVLFQHSTLGALMQADYQGDMSVSTLAGHGDFGLGTFAALDGEMLVWQGRCYQIKSDGRVYPASGSLQTPFAATCFFKPEIIKQLSAVPDLVGLEKALDAELPTPNLFYALALEGEFASIKVRSVPRQTPPYRPLAEVVKTQPVYEWKNIKGLLVGFRCPAYAQGVNLPGYHFHFITQDRQQGGHMLACELAQGTVAIARLSKLELDLPGNQEFYGLDLSQDQSAKVKQAEH